MSTITQRRGDDPTSGMARVESAVFQDGAQSLFVPRPAMWTIHNAGKPRAVLERAGLGLRMWEQWQSQWGRDHPLLAWLYDHPGGRRDHDCVELPEGFSISPAMKAFREHSSGYKITKKVGRKPIDYWKRKHGELEWFRGWLLRGEDQPKGLRIATADQVHRAAKAFDYVSHCHRAGIDADVTYRSWIIDGLIPNLNWLQWLYGWPVPQYTFVVQTPLQAIRKEMAIWGLCEAAGTTDKVYRNWNSAEFKDVVEELKKEAARRPGDPDKLPTLQGAWEQLPLQTKRSLWRFALAADPKACRKRAGLTEQAYLGYLRDARRCGVDFQLEQYLNRTGSFGPTKSRQAGLLAPKFFVPTPSMLSFREVALKELTRLEIFHEIARLPCLDLWFKHMTIPGEVRGQRHKLLDERSPGQERNGHAHHNGNPHGATGGEPIPSAAKNTNPGPMPTQEYGGVVITRFLEEARQQMAEIWTGQPLPGGDARIVVALGASWNDPVIVRRVPKKFDSFSQFKVVKALVEAGDNGLNKDQLEEVQSTARRILRGLRQDPDWAAVIEMPVTGGGKYRIVRR